MRVRFCLVVFFLLVMSGSALAATRIDGGSYCNGVTSGNNTVVQRIISPFYDGKRVYKEDNFKIDNSGYAYFYSIVIGAPTVPSISYTANNYKLTTFTTPYVVYCGDIRAGRVHKWMIPKGKYTKGSNYIQVKYSGFTYNYNFKLNY